ncbi:predicted protein [Chaetoceros tenuissimus]|uniref:Uncharacterized protein n=1 Tax=Chaetoceros tenuissimus TaxID=426638 RepID=A0AAD3DEZ2_9STRA|nr:predicted protein [Chaetoceros tenuissimus]
MFSSFGKKDEEETPTYKIEETEKMTPYDESKKEEEVGDKEPTPTAPPAVEDNKEDDSGEGKEGAFNKVFELKSSASPQGEEVAASSVPRSAGLSCATTFRLKISYILCTFAMSIFFITGASYLTLSQVNIEEPYSFILIGTLFYITMCILDLILRKSIGKVMELVAAIVNLVGSCFWFIGSCFLFSKTLDLQVWSGLWIVGSCCNLYSFIYDTVIVTQKFKTTKPLFKILALSMGIMANLFFLGAASGILSRDNGGGNVCTNFNSTRVLVAGSVMYLLYGIFKILEWQLGHVHFSFAIVMIEKEENDAPSPQVEEDHEEVEEGIEIADAAVADEDVVIVDTKEQEEV